MSLKPGLPVDNPYQESDLGIAGSLSSFKSSTRLARDQPRRGNSIKEVNISDHKERIIIMIQFERP